MKKLICTKNYLASALSVLLVVVITVVSVSFPATALVTSKKGEITYKKSIIDKYSKAAEAIVNGMRNYEPVIDLSDYDVLSTDIAELVYTAQIANPELYYVDLRFQYYYYDGYATGILPEYKYKKAVVETMNKKLDDAVYKYLLKINDSMTDFEKAVILHDEIIVNCEYAYSGENVDNCYGALVEGTALCQGYATAYSYLLSLAGINSELVESLEMQHMWNSVQLDGRWYHVDVTMDDPLMNGYDATGFAYHTFFLLSDDQIQNMADKNRNHYGFESAYHKCTSKKYDNYLLHEIDTKLCFVNGNAYAIDNQYKSTYEKQLLKYDYKNDRATVVKNIGGRWKSGDSKYWNGGFMSLYDYNGRLYYNTVNSVICYDLATGRESVYYNADTTQLFGMMIVGRDVYADKRASLLVGSDMRYIGTLEYVPEPTTVEPTTMVHTTDKPTTQPTTVAPTTETTTVAPTTDPFYDVIKGDVNRDGVIAVDDATMIQKATAELINLKSDEFYAADYNCDGKVSVDDSTEIQKFIAME